VLQQDFARIAALLADCPPDSTCLLVNSAGVVVHSSNASIAVCVVVSA
jgi:hypothetical protein